MFRRAAFTLVELMVVLLVTMLLAGSAAAFMRVVSGARELAEHRLQGRQEAAVALRTITTALRNAYRPVTDNDVLFVGVLERSDPYPIGRVKFRTIERRIIRPGQPESDVHEVEFFMREQNGKPVLMRRTDPTRNLPPDGGGIVEPLAMDVVGLDLQYLDAGKWEDRWPETMNHWPTAINVRLIYRPDSTSARLDAVSAMVKLPYWNSISETNSNSPTQ